MNKLIILLAFLASVPAFASDASIQIEGKNVTCSYDVLHYNQGQNKRVLALSITENLLSARVTASVQSSKANNHKCRDFSFIEIDVNESILPTKSAKIGKRLISKLNSTSYSELHINAANIKNGEAEGYTVATMNLDGSNQTESHFTKVTRTFVSIGNIYVDSGESAKYVDLLE